MTNPHVVRTPELRLTAPGVAPETVSDSLQKITDTQISAARAFLAGESDVVPNGILQASYAYREGEERDRDYFVEQFSQAFGAGVYGFDTVMNAYESATTTDGSGYTVQRSAKGPDTVTLGLGPIVKERFGVPADQEALIEGATFRKVTFDAGVESVGQSIRQLTLCEVEIPLTVIATGEQTMGRTIYFKPSIPEQ